MFLAAVLFFLPLADSILPNISYTYTNTATPHKFRDLGQTVDTSIHITNASPENVTITIDIAISLSAAFKGPTLSTNIEMQNPGLESEVRAHEEAHKDQIMEAAHLPIRLIVKIDDHKTRFTGSADRVIVNATLAFNEANEAKSMSKEEKKEFIEKNIVIPALERLGKRISSVMVESQDVEVDANKRVYRVLGEDRVRYLRESASILFNNTVLR